MHNSTLFFRHCLQYLVISLFIAGLPTAVSAQIVGTNAFMQGDFVEIGVNQCGAYGSSGAAPAGYHPTMVSDALGFVADDDMDGWVGGTFPPYCGDYFLPGSPVEGWGVQIGASTWYNTNSNCAPFAIPGSIASYDAVGDIITVVWEGNITSEDVSITQTTTLIVDKRYFVTRINICNNDTETKNDIYYKRNVDPDNDQPWSGSFVTENVIISNPPADENALVTSEGLTYGCFLGLGARTPNARVSWGNFATTTGTPSQVYAGTGGFSITGSSTGDIANSIAFYVETLAPGECACFAFAYILDAEELEEALTATTVTDVLVNGSPVGVGETFIVCDPGDPISIEVTGADDYTFTWSPADIFDVDTGTTVSATPTAPTTLVTALGEGGECGDLLVEFTLVVAEEPVIEIEDTVICGGDIITLDLLAEAGDTPCEPVPFINTTDYAIPAGPSVSSPITVSGVAAGTFSLDNFEYVCINVDHNFLVDLDIFLECPDGTLVELTTDNGGSGDDYTNTCFIPAGAPSITTGTAPFTGFYTPEGDFSDFIGCDINGTWNLVVDDDLAGTLGTLLDWSIAFTCENAFSTYTWSPAAGLSSTTVEDPAASPDTTTTYTVTLTDLAGCSYTEDVTVTVSSPVAAIFSYPEPFYCPGDTDPSPEFAPSGGPGTFSFSPPGLVIDLSSGVVDLSASTPGTYTVTNTIAATADCPEYTHNAVITIQPVYAVTLNPEICDDASYVLADGTVVNTTGTYTTTVTSTLGCDSTIVTNLTVYPTYEVDVAAEICEGEFYALPDGGFAASTGVYPITLSSVNGCDSLVTTALTVHPVYDITIPVSLCDDEVIVLPDGTVISDPPAGIYSYTFSTTDGCDSTVSVDLTILPVYDLAETVIICDGDTYTLPDGSTASSAGDYVSNLTTAAGCDSVITTTIVVNELFFTALEPAICADEFYTLPDGSITASAGTYSFTLTATNGCDSTVTVNLTVYPTYATSFSASICSGDNYVLPDGTTLIAPTAGSYPVTLASVNGCDSVVTVNLSLWPVYDITIPAEICAGTTYTLPDGSTTGSEGDYVFSYTTINGCDSTVTIALTVNPLPTPTIDITADGYCIDAGTQTLIATPAGGTWSGTGVSGTTFNPTTAGIGGPYFIQYSYTDINGCTDSTFTTLEVYALPEPELVLPPYACLDADAVPLVGLPDGGFFSGAGVLGDDFIPEQAGPGTGFGITYTYTDGNGCTSSVSGTLDVLENIVDAGTDTSLFIGDTILLGFGTEGDIVWTPTNSISCADCPVLYFFPTFTTTYTITETDPNGCVATDKFTVWVRTEPNADIFAPSAFTPNGDGINDYFMIYGQDIVNILSLRVFDRWGELIFLNENIAPGNELQGWNGFVRGSGAVSGVYAFIAEIELKGGTVVVSKGNVTLLL